jgi:hypothetical protein
VSIADFQVPYGALTLRREVFLRVVLPQIERYPRVARFLAESPKGRALSFEYWWPPDRNWCVCSGHDLAFTIVGGSRKRASVLLASEVLECPHTRIDSLAPLPLKSGN